MNCLGDEELVTFDKNTFEILNTKFKNVELINRINSNKLLKVARKIKNIKDIKPLYLRKSQAEIALEAKQKRG